MISFLKKYKAFFIGLIVIPIFYVLRTMGIIIIPEDRPLNIIPYMIFCGLAIALPIHFSKMTKTTIINVFGLILFVFCTLVIDSFMNVPDNPITFTL